MQIVTVMQLTQMKEADLNKMTKAELVASITKENWMPNHYKAEAEAAKKILADNATNERAACVMLAAFAGVPLDRNEYSGDINTKQLNILELAGLVAAKCVRDNRQ